MAQTDLSEAKLYDQWCADIRATDDVSFKLIGIVPLVSGTGLLAILLPNAGPSPKILVTLSLFAAGVTLGLLRWELWNLGNCKWVIACVEELEDKVVKSQAQRPRIWMGKAGAEKIIYGVTIFTWLSLPVALVPSEEYGSSFWWVYTLLATAIAVTTIVALFLKVDVKDSHMKNVTS